MGRSTWCMTSPEIRCRSASLSRRPAFAMHGMLACALAVSAAVSRLAEPAWSQPVWSACACVQFLQCCCQRWQKLCMRPCICRARLPSCSDGQMDLAWRALGQSWMFRSLEGHHDWGQAAATWLECNHGIIHTCSCDASWCTPHWTRLDGLP